jgi:hypothetical protein
LATQLVLLLFLKDPDPGSAIYQQGRFQFRGTGGSPSLREKKANGTDLRLSRSRRG